MLCLTTLPTKINNVCEALDLSSSSPLPSSRPSPRKLKRQKNPPHTVQQTILYQIKRREKRKGRETERAYLLCSIQLRPLFCLGSREKLRGWIASDGTNFRLLLLLLLLLLLHLLLLLSHFVLSAVHTDKCCTSPPFPSAEDSLGPSDLSFNLLFLPKEQEYLV